MPIPCLDLQYQRTLVAHILQHRRALKTAINSQERARLYAALGDRYRELLLFPLAL
jgi:hypothetical protein